MRPFYFIITLQISFQAMAAIDFEQEILPIFEGSCLECHGPDKQKGDIRIDRRAMLLKGGESDLPSVVPGAPDESLMMELIRGDFEDEIMPPKDKGEPLSGEQIALIEQWIREGAPWMDEPERTIDYARQVQPIFQENCYVCHGPDKQESNFRTDLRASLLKGGDMGLPAIVPGDPEAGELLMRIHSLDKAVRMPRDGAPLSDEKLSVLKTWIAEGAYWPGQMEVIDEEVTTELWSMQPLERPDAPRSRARNPIDAFVEEKLEAEGLTANGRATPEVLIRRASLVLTGLPPAPERIDAFVAKWKRNSKRAWKELLDELFASPHYGERWAQHWLDVVRWAETGGSESNDFRKNAWPYRDYVIEAFNEDKPYDRFIKEQVAGDVYGEDAAMGFLVAGPHVPALTVGRQERDIKQARSDQLDETLQSVGSAFMAMTMSCARCHSHKFDPISITDYYSMTAAFHDIAYDHRLPELPEDDIRSIEGKRIEKEMEALRSELAEFGPWEEHWPDHLKAHFAPVETDRIRIRFDKKKFVLYELGLFDSTLSRENLGLLSGVEIKSSKIDEGDDERYASHPSKLLDDEYSALSTWRHFETSSEGKPWLELTLPSKETIARIELSGNRLIHYGLGHLTSAPWMGKSPIDSSYTIEYLDTDGEWRQAARMVNGKARPEPGVDALIERLDKLALEYEEKGPQPIFAGRLMTPKPAYMLYRGDPMQPKQEVFSGAPEVLGGNFDLPKDASGPERRKAMGDWLADPENPLTSRVMVNRLWYLVFGRGIVSTPSDFGYAGDTPTHPELLDWLASEFIDRDWSVKTMLRLMVESEAFLRSSEPKEASLAIDANSRYLWRFQPRWLEAEVLRDSILSAAGSLDLTIGGPSYRIHNVKKRFSVWKVVDNSGPETWRRLLYQERMRGVDDRMFSSFDFPDCGQPRSKRSRSTTPLQAFNLMNGDLVMTQSSKLAERAIAESGPDIEKQIRIVFSLVLGRSPKGMELEDSVGLVQQDGLESLARVLFNLNEFRYLQ